MGGIGKTALAVKLAEQIQGEFEYLIWRSLPQCATDPRDLADSIKFLSNQQQVDLPENVERRISLLIHCLQAHRCLLILDNAEAILQEGSLDTIVDLAMRIMASYSDKWEKHVIKVVAPYESGKNP